MTLTFPLSAVADALTVKVEEPELVTLVGLSVAVRPLVALAVRLTVPVNPPTAATLQVVVAELPWATVIGLVHMRVKSCTLTVTIVVRVRDPLAPVTVTM